MLKKYSNFMRQLLADGETTPTWDFFRNDILSVDSKAEYSMLIQSICGPHSIPEYALEDENAIPVVMYDPEDKSFKLQFSDYTTPVMINDADTWLESLLLFWHDTPESTDEDLEKLAKGLICHSVNSFFTHDHTPYTVEHIFKTTEKGAEQ